MKQKMSRMKTLWSNRKPGVIALEEIHENAVLLPLLCRGEALHVLFEVRAAGLRIQPGEVCFPGGAVEPGETTAEAAVRETMEELLIRKDQVELAASLDVLHSPANLTLWPYLAFLHGYEGTFSKAEVERIVTIPLDWFIEHDPDVYMTRVETVPEGDFPFDLVPGGRQYRWRQGSYQVPFYKHENAVIWGMTAKILHSFVLMYRQDMLNTGKPLLTVIQGNEGVPHQYPSEPL